MNAAERAYIEQDQVLEAATGTDSGQHGER